MLAAVTTVPRRSIRPALTVLTLLAAAASASAQSCDAWSVVGVPDPGDARTIINGLHARSATDVWAVGDRMPLGGGDRAPLSFHYDGATWTEIPVPNPAWIHDRQAWLRAVDGTAADDVWAVGAFIHPGEADVETFVVRWDGATWSWVDSPTQPNGSGAVFSDVAAIGPDDLWAVGSWPGLVPGGGNEGLAAHWDGSDWTVAAMPVEIIDLRMTAIDAHGADEIWAIGNAEIPTAGPFTPFIVRYDGSSWTYVEPRPDEAYQSVGDIEVLAADDVWVSAFRWNEDDVFDPEPVFLHWDGAAWTEHANPGGRLLVAGDGALRAVDLHSVSVWDGAQWQLSASSDPAPGDPNAFLRDAVAYDGCAMFGAGKSGVGDSTRVLVVEGRDAPACAADLDGSGDVGFDDLLAILAAWGAADHPADLDASGTVDFGDLLLALGAWGACA